MAYIYHAEIYCDACGEAIKEELKIKDGGESDGYPQYCDDDSEADSPQHCGNHAECLEAEVLPSGDKIGKLIGTNLTSVGVEYIKETIKEGGEVAEFWQEQFEAYL